jgi:HK97 family phage portal protein
VANWFEKLNPGRYLADRAEMKALENRLETIVGEQEDWSAKYLDAEPTSYSGPGTNLYGSIEQQIDNQVLANLYMTETWVYVAVNAVAETIAGLPVKLEKRKILPKKVRNSVTGQDEVVDEETWVNANGEKLARRLNKPNEYTTKAEFFQLLAIDLLTAGEFYVWLDSDIDLTSMPRDTVTDSTDPDAPYNRLLAAMGADSKIKGMYRIPPQLMRPVPTADRRGIEGYVMASDQGQFAYSFAEIIHVKRPNPADPFRGLSPLIAAFKPVLLDRFSTEHMIRFYKSGARLGGVITSEKHLNKEQLSRFQRSFEGNYTGRQNHHRTLVLPPGMKYEAIEQNPAETSLLDFCRYNREAILAAVKVPPIKVGVMEHANYANALVQLKLFFQDTIIPHLTLIEDGFNNKTSLMPPGSNFRMKFDLSQVEALKENFKDTAETAKAMMDGGMSVNEVRARVWNLPPVDDGDKVKVIEDIKAGKTGESNSLFGNLSAPTGNVETKDDPTAAELSAELTGPQTTAVMNVLGRVSKGRLSADQAVELLVSAYGIPRKLACKLCGVEYKEPEKPCDKCQKTPCACPPQGGPGMGEEMKGGAPTLENFIADAMAKLSPGESVTPEFMRELISIYETQYPQSKEVTPDSAPTQGDIQSEPKSYASGHTKDQVVEHWKNFISKAEPIQEDRLKTIRAWFAKVKAVILHELGANVKSFGLHKSRDKSDVDAITKLENFEKLLEEYKKGIEADLEKAMEEGYVAELKTSMKFTGELSEEALAQLRDYAADKVKGILETTMDQMREVLTDGFEKSKPIGEISKAINEKFAEIDNGRAITIARTETLTAVSMGREAKRQDFKKQFPDRVLKKMWVSAQDDRVRDSHAELDGTSVGVDEAFDNGCMYPRDPNGAPEEVINCRCTDITFDAEDESLIEDTLGDQGEADAEETADVALNDDEAADDEEEERAKS